MVGYRRIAEADLFSTNTTLSSVERTDHPSKDLPKVPSSCGGQENDCLAVSELLMKRYYPRTVLKIFFRCLSEASKQAKVTESDIAVSLFKLLVGPCTDMELPHRPVSRKLLSKAQCKNQNGSFPLA